MAGKRPRRFEPRQYDEKGNWAVWDLLKDRWYKPYDHPVISLDKAEIEERCQNFQRIFEFGNPLPFLDPEESGPDFMEPDYAFKK